MPGRAFVPSQLIEAQPRVYKGLRPRQAKGIGFAIGGALVALLVTRGAGTLSYAAAFLAALPGFAYGYYQVGGKPVEYWLRVIYRYYTAPQILTASPKAMKPKWRLDLAQWLRRMTALVALMIPIFPKPARRRKELKKVG